MKKQITERPLFLAPLPPMIWNNKNLSTLDRFILAIMINLARNANGFCYATNETLANYLNCSPGSVSKSISKMLEYGFIVKNEPRPENGGRRFNRTLRPDLFYKSPIHQLEGSHANKARQPSEKGIQSYLNKEESNNKLPSSEEEKKFVEKILKKPIRGKWKFFETCKTAYNKQHHIIWNLKNIADMVKLLSKLNALYENEFEKLTCVQQNSCLLQIFELFLDSKPSFLISGLPATFLQYFDSIVVKEGFKRKVESIVRNSSRGRHYF